MIARTAALFIALHTFALGAPGQQPPSPGAHMFTSPEEDAKPMVRWWWFGVAVEKPEILRELQQMKADGIGGVELAFVYPEVVDDPARGLKNLPFLSPPMLDAVRFAQAEARKLNLRVDVTLCSGWPYGGPATTLTDAATRLRTIEVAIPANTSVVTLPTLADGETIVSSMLVEGNPTPPPVRGNRAAPPPIGWDQATARPLAVDGRGIAPSATARVALFFVQSHTGQQVKRAAVGSEGFVLDPFSRKAVATHLEAVGEPLVGAFGSSPPYAIFSDSLEAYGADWTPSLPAEFRRRRGYDLIPHLAELVAGGSPAAERVRHDYGRTLTELVDENYLTQIDAWAKAHHTKFRSQTYGEPAVSLASQRLVALPEGEGPQWRAFSTLRWATSANHLFGNKVTSGETFTWLHSPVFRATPLDMKAEADIDFIMGENQLIFHGWPYSPPQASANGEPGWSLYAAAVFNDSNPWHPVMPAVTQYITRISSLLRRGEPANQVAILLPTDDAWSSFSPGRVSVSGAMTRLVSPTLISSILSAGYNFDFIDADTIDRLGIHHQILILPPTDRVPLPTLRKIAAFVQAGGKVIAVDRAPTLDADGRPSAELTQLSQRLFTPVASANLGQSLHIAGTPDFQLATSVSSTRNTIGFIRRRLPSSDIYFVVNTSNAPIEASTTFATSHGHAEQIDPDSGVATPASVSGQVLRLAPYESRVFVFTDASPAPPSQSATPLHPLADLSTGWQVTFSRTGKSTFQKTLADWTADPDTLHYSGEAVYTRDFTLAKQERGPVYIEIPGGKPLPGSPESSDPQPALGPNGQPNALVTRTGPGMHAFFDPPIHEAALVRINGQPAGALWHPPYQLDVSRLLKSGPNSIEIRVYNTALNAWSALPPHDYKPLIEQYGDRFQMQDLDRVKPLPSGLLGPIYLMMQDTK